MAAVASIIGGQAINDITQGTQVLRVQIQLSGNYGTSTSHGDILALNLYGAQSTNVLSYVINEMPAAGTAPSGAQWGYAKGSNLSNGKLTAMTANATELAQGSAYTAAMQSAVIIGTFYLTPFM